MGQNRAKINAIQSKSYKIKRIIIKPKILNKLPIERRVKHPNRASVQNATTKV